ncbi:MAG: hypothetical protein OEW08_14035, partial [Gammaproteobacteria bacterium]|nr:hypothetical protein [Gammaproteobacteria bacterium]
TTGTYTVLPVFSTGNTLGLTVHGASLSVAAAPTPPTSGKFVALPALPTGATRKPLDIIYDAERSRVLVGLLYPNTPTKPSDAGDISQYNLGADSSLTLDTTVHTPGYEPIANLKNIALSTDGKSIVAITTFGDVFQLDANSLANQRHITSTFSFNGLAMSNDGTALLTSSSTNGYSNIYTQRYALSDGTLTSLNNGNQYYIGQSDPVSSGDGSTIFYSAKQNNLNNYVRYQSLNGAMDTPSGMTSLVGFTSAVDKHATRVVFSTTGNTSFSVITFNPSKSLAPVALPNTNIGSLLQPSIAAPSAPVRVALSPSGDKAYFCCNSFTPTGGVKNTYVRACDLTIYSAVTGYKCVDTAIVADPGTGVSTGNGYKMAIAPDGGTLFILGDTNIVVLPTSTLLQ